MAAIGTSVALRSGMVFFISVEVSDGVFGILTRAMGGDILQHLRPIAWIWRLIMLGRLFDD